MPNNDLISRKALLGIYKNWLPQLTRPEDAGDRSGVETCIAVLQDAPAVDAEPVRYGRWIFYSKASLGGHNVWMCSECDTSYNYVECMNYCPNCGAKMED